MLTIRDDFNGSSSSNVDLPFTARPYAASLQDHLKRAPLRGIEAKDHVFAEGDPKSHIYQVVTGAVCLYKVLPDGRRQVIDFAYGGDFLSLSLGSVETYNAQATVATRVRCLSVSALSGLASRDPAIAMRICEAVSAELAAVRDHLVCVVQRSATERVVTFLLALSERNNARNRDCDTLELPMTRADIGDFLGLTIETVSRTFTKLKCRGLIEISQGTTIRLRDTEGLRAMADGTVGK
jgi:CRP-like cAMP-binding protein